MFKVLVSDKMAAEGIRILEGAAPLVEVTVQTAWKPGELREKIGGYHGLLIRSATKVTAEIIAAADSLRVIGRAGIGVDNVDLAAASRKGIVVMNTPTGNIVTTAEHALAMMMALARKIPQATASMRSGAWEKSAFEGVELYEKTLGLLGLGNIGSLVARRAACLGMRVVAYDPLISAERAAQLGVRLLDLDELLACADFISLHVPKNEQTAHSGAGKSTLIRQLMAADPGLQFSISFTTRPPRPGEVPGRDYFFVTPEEFRDLQGRGGLVEWVDIGDSWEKQDGQVGDDLLVLRITSRAATHPKPSLFILSSIHARELTPAELNTRFAELLVTSYGVDPDITWLLDYTEIHLLLQANPDGRRYAELATYPYNYWRKNTNNNYCSDTSGKGKIRKLLFSWLSLVLCHCPVGCYPR